MITDRRSAWLFAIAGLVNLAQWITIATWPASSVAPLHYTIYFGIDLTGEAWQLYALPAVGVLILVFHYFISLTQASVLWSRVWAITATTWLVLLSTVMITLRVVTTQ